MDKTQRRPPPRPCTKTRSQRYPIAGTSGAALRRQRLVTPSRFFWNQLTWGLFASNSFWTWIRPTAQIQTIILPFDTRGCTEITVGTKSAPSSTTLVTLSAWRLLRSGSSKLTGQVVLVSCAKPQGLLTIAESHAHFGLPSFRLKEWSQSLQSWSTHHRCSNRCFSGSNVVVLLTPVHFGAFLFQQSSARHTAALRYLIQLYGILLGCYKLTSWVLNIPLCFNHNNNYLPCCWRLVGVCLIFLPIYLGWVYFLFTCAAMICGTGSILLDKNMLKQ